MDKKKNNEMPNIRFVDRDKKKGAKIGKIKLPINDKHEDEDEEDDDMPTSNDVKSILGFDPDKE